MKTALCGLSARVSREALDSIPRPQEFLSPTPYTLTSMKIQAVEQQQPVLRPAPRKTAVAGAAEPQDGYTASALPEKPAIDKADLKQALGNFPTGVTVVTTGQGDARHGMTASSFNSVSLDPPLVLFSAGNDSSTLKELEKNGTFAINLLAADQGEVCYKFAKGTQTERFQGLDTRAAGTTGSPLLPGTLGHFDCEVHQIVPAGDHSIVIGRVVGLEHSQNGEPLTFWGGKLQITEGWARRAK